MYSSLISRGEYIPRYTILHFTILMGCIKLENMLFIIRETQNFSKNLKFI